MIKSKLHNPIIANNSHIENAVIEKVTTANEQAFSDLGNVTPVVPETGRIWFNTESGTFKFANVGVGGDGNNYVDEFLSRTDNRTQGIASKINFGDTVKINDTAGNAILTVDATSKDVTVNGANGSTTLTGNDVYNITGNTETTVGGTYDLEVTGNSSEILKGDHTVTVTGNVVETFNGNQTVKVVGDLGVEVGNVATVKDSSGNVKLQANNTANSFGVNYSTIGVNGQTETHTMSDKFVVNDGTNDKFVLDITNDKASVTFGTIETTSANTTFNVSTALKLTDGTNDKVVGDNTTNTLTVNYANVGINGQTVTQTLSNKLVINDGVSDKYIVDNTNDKVTLIYATVESTTTNTTDNVSGSYTLTDGTNNKVVANHTNNTLDITYAETTITGNATVDGNMLITGDLTIGGQTTKVDVAAENMTIADNVVILNSNLTTEDPRLASAIVDGEDVDNDAGIAVNRGSEGILDLIKWVESIDTSSAETLKEGTAKVSIWNYEAASPAYELHQIIDAYTLARQTINKSGAGKVGFDGHSGSNYNDAIGSGATPAEALEYSFKLDAGFIDSSLDSVVQEIDTIKFGGYNKVRVGETNVSGKTFTITHNLGTVFVDVKIQREEAGKWYFDVIPVEVVDANTVMIESAESTKIRYMITAVEGFDVNQATELVVV